MSLERSKVEHLVVDTNTFIKNSALQDIAVNVYTVQDVLDEITNKRQLRNLVVLPYNINVKDIHTEDVKFVTEFSKKTGDYISLSAADLKLIALTYQLEKEIVGTEHLKKEPQYTCVVNTTSKTPEDCTKIPGFYVPKKMGHKLLGDSDDGANCVADDEINGGSFVEDDIGLCKDIFLKSVSENSGVQVSSSDTENAHENSAAIISSESVSDINRDKHPLSSETLEVTEKYVRDKNSQSLSAKENGCADDADIESSSEHPERNNEEFDSWRDCDGTSSSSGDENGDDGDDDDDDDDDYDDDDDADWITQDNIGEIKKSIGGGDLEDKSVLVACITSDFAMQNVLKQIGLNVISIDGRLIRQVRTFVLRCYSCFKRTSIMTKVFCPHCGNRTLKKVAISVRENGSQEIHINTRKPLSGKGKRFSIPRLKGGKHTNDPILCEDQRIPQQKPSRLACKQNNPLDPDYIAGYSPFVMRDITSRSAMLGIRHGNMKNYFRRSDINKPKKRK